MCTAEEGLTHIQTSQTGIRMFLQGDDVPCTFSTNTTTVAQEPLYSRPGLRGGGRSKRERVGGEGGGVGGCKCRMRSTSRQLSQAKPHLADMHAAPSSFRPYDAGSVGTATSAPKPVQPRKGTRTLSRRV